MILFFIIFLVYFHTALMQKQICCPQNSWPRLQTNYKPKGQHSQIANTSSYHIGSGDKILVVVSDIWGATSGYHEAFADTFSQFGYNVYLPQILTDPYVGDMDSKLMIKCIKNQDFNIMRQRFLGLTKYLEQKGHKKFFVIGFCWGVWFAFKMANQVQNIIAIAGMHPALGLQHSFGGDVTKLVSKVKCPAYLFPAGNDPDNIKPHGQLIKILQQKFGSEKTGSHQFPNMVHGWTVRGDIKDPKVKKDTTKAIQMCKVYFSRFQKLFSKQM